MHETFHVLATQREDELQREATIRHRAAGARTARSRPSTRVMRRVRPAIVGLAVAMLLTAVPLGPSVAAPGDNTVSQWNEIALNTVLNDSARRTPSAAILYTAITQLAVYDAVMAIEGTHEPYAFKDVAPAGASVDAAVATAAHDVLVNYFPAQTSTLDAAYAASLAGIPDGTSQDDGVTVGRGAAQTIIAVRVDDGRDAPVPAPADGTLPGQWRRTSTGSVVTPYVGQVKPFLVDSVEYFRSKGSDPLTSHRYAVEFERTRLYGAKSGSLRSPEQTEIAQFWTENTVGQYNRALRGFATTRELSIGDTALVFAMTDVPAADAMITCWNTKFHYLAWRPVTAIREAATDGNNLTTADPSWEPLSPTALHPEYVSGHACLTGAITRGLREFLGTKDIDLAMDSTVTGSTHHFQTIDDLRTEVEDARVYGGDHWETGGTDGTNLGDDLAKVALHRYFGDI